MKRIISFIIAVFTCLSLVSCSGILNNLNNVLKDLDLLSDVIFNIWDKSESVEWPEEDEGRAIHMTVGESADISSYISEAEEVEWSSGCPAVVTVEDGVITAQKVGRTTVYASLGAEVLESFVVTSEFMITTNGFDFTTTKVDENAYQVESLAEANRILDLAIAEHYHKIRIDFSLLSEEFNVQNDFDLNSEFGSHTSLKMYYYPSTPYIVDFEIVYNTDGASYTTPESGDYSYNSAPSANAIIRSYYASLTGTPRADDYEGFAINSIEETFDVYNSEELWWVVEHGYKPAFPIEGTKAELIYERAKMVLRDIIVDGMSDYEKALAIYEYVIDSVVYDYDAYYNFTTTEKEKDNTCYYLEGVFETGRAVCDGKSKAIVLLCGIEGIPAVRAFGEMLSGGNIGHAWNYVEIDGVWYMVDTTEGDARYDQGSNPVRFFGGKFETVSYDSFLIAVNHHASKYEYTDMWASIASPEHGSAYPTSYYDVDIGATGYDFIINSTEEVNAIFDILGEAGMPKQFVLTYIPSNMLMVNFAFRSALQKWGCTMETYTVTVNGKSINMAFIKVV